MRVRPLGTPFDTFRRMQADMTVKEFEQHRLTYGNQTWRLNHLYHIVGDTPDGAVENTRVRQIMKLAWAQRELYENMWYRNIILKARQVYMTTFAQAFALDMALFEPDTQVGVIAHTVDDAEAIFTSKIKFMYDNLPPFLKSAVPYTKGNARELYFDNGSRIRVATSLRSGTLDFLHVSEFAKICAQGRSKAQEVIGGSFNTVGAKGIIVVESTAEGPTGEFADLYWNSVELDKAVKRGDEELTSLDFKPFFFPCYRHPAYRLRDAKVVIPPDTESYFEQFEEEHGITFPKEYQTWYARKSKTQGELMKQEFPNTDVEAFMKRNEGAIFASQLAEAEEDGRVAPLPFVRGLPVNVAFDLGRNDTTAMWFYQLHGGWANFVRTYEHRLVDVMHYVEILREYELKYKYHYGTLYLPHDGAHLRIDSIAGSTRDIFQRHGFKVRVIDRPTVKNVSIERARRAMSFCRFDKKACADGLDAMRKYHWKWDDVHGTFRLTPEHDDSSNYADAFQTFAYKFSFPTESLPTKVDTTGMYLRDPKKFHGSSEDPRWWNPDTSVRV